MEGKRGRILQILLIAVFMLAIVFFGISIIQGIRQYTAAQADVKVRQQAVDQQEKLLAELQSQPKSEQRMLGQIALLEKLIPGDPEQDGVITGLSQAAQIAGATLVSVEFTGNAATGGDAAVIPTTGDASLESVPVPADCVAIPVFCSFKGSYGSMLEVLNQMQFGQRLYRLDQLTISRLDGEGQEIQMNVTGACFYRYAH